MSDCLDCKKSNPNEAAIARAEQYGRTWAIQQNQPSFNIVKQKNGAYTWKDPRADHTNFELIAKVYV